jgi:hypothetical protein
MALDSSAAGSNQVVSVACGAQFIILDVISSALTVLQFDITFPSITCTLLNVDTTNISGEKHLIFPGSTFRTDRSESSCHPNGAKFR